MHQNWEGTKIGRDPLGNSNTWQFKHSCGESARGYIVVFKHYNCWVKSIWMKTVHVGLYQNIYNGDQRGAQQLLVSEPLRKNFQSHSPKHGLRPRLHEENFMISMLQLVFLVYFPSISISQHFSWDSNIWGFP